MLHNVLEGEKWIISAIPKVNSIVLKLKESSYANKKLLMCYKIISHILKCLLLLFFRKILIFFACFFLESFFVFLISFTCFLYLSRAFLWFFDSIYFVFLYIEKKKFKKYFVCFKKLTILYELFKLYHLCKLHELWKLYELFKLYKLCI